VIGVFALKTIAFMTCYNDQEARNCYSDKFPYFSKKSENSRVAVSDWKTYTNKNIGYQINYPTNWQIYENVDGVNNKVKIFDPTRNGKPDTDLPSVAIYIDLKQEICKFSNWEVGFALVYYKTACIQINPNIHVTMVAFDSDSEYLEDQILSTFKFTN